MNNFLDAIDARFAPLNLERVYALESDIRHVTWSNGDRTERLRGSDIIRALKFRNRDMGFVAAWSRLFQAPPTSAAQRVLLALILPA